LAEHYGDEAQTLSLLLERAMKDGDSRVRRAAVSGLAEYYRDEAQTLPLLHERSVKDETPKPEEQKEKGEFWKQFVRDTAIESIAKYWRDHPDTLPLLRDRAENDPTPWLRERAKELIEEIEGKKK
jgi:HEAT repeat protein